MTGLIALIAVLALAFLRVPLAFALLGVVHYLALGVLWG